MTILGAALVVAGPIWFQAGWSLDDRADDVDLTLPVMMGLVSFFVGIFLCVVSA